VQALVLQLGLDIPEVLGAGTDSQHEIRLQFTQKRMSTKMTALGMVVRRSPGLGDGGWSKHFGEHAGVGSANLTEVSLRSTTVACG